MKIFIVRHGHAIAHAETDSARLLSERGRQEVKLNVERHLNELSSVEHIFSSPYRRARQTADIVQSYLDRSISELPFLTPDSDPSQALEYFYHLASQYTCVLMTSHMPLVSRLTDRLIGVEPGTNLFSTAAIGSLECDPVAASCCELKWLHHP